MRRLLLDASPAELRGEGTSEIARLVRDHADLRAVAERLLADMRALDAGLAELGRLGGGRVPLRDVASVVPAVRPRSSAPSFGWRFALGTAAGAVALAVALTLRAPAPPSATAVREPSITATLDASSPRPFAVFATDNPDIAIVWLLDTEES